MSTYCILSIDGGGIRGIVAAKLLEQIYAEVPDFVDCIDLIAGTSTGGIIALGLADGLSPSDLVKFYQDRGPIVFQDSLLEEIKDLGNLIGAEYGTEGLKNELEKIFGRVKLKQLKKRVLIPSFNLDNHATNGNVHNWKPKFFHNFPGAGSDGDELALDVALRTSAAPIYFPTYQGYIDGGVVANNPSMAALAQALDTDTGNQSLNTIRLFSLGTGTNPKYISGETHDWGIVQWAKPLINLTFDGMMSVTDYECSHLLGERYHRLQPTLPEPVSLDEVGKIDELLDFAAKVNISDTINWLKKTLPGSKETTKPISITNTPSYHSN